MVDVYNKLVNVRKKNIIKKKKNVGKVYEVFYIRFC